MVIRGKSQYDSTKVFIDGMIEACEKQGMKADILDSYDEDVYAAVREQTAHTCYDYIFAMNGMLLEAGSLLGRELLRDDVIYCTMLMDHPLVHHERMSTTYPYCFVLSPDFYHVEYLEAGYPAIWCEAFLAHGGCRAKKILPYRERSIAVSFMGSYSNPDNIYKEFEKYPPQMAVLLQETAEYLIKHHWHTLEMAVQHQLKQRNIQISGEEFTGILAEFRVVDKYIRAYFRDKVIRTLAEAGVTIDVYGDGWENMQLQNNSSLKVHGRVDFEESLEITGDTKISLNIMPWFKAGSHDRVFTAMLCGSVCLTDSSIYLEEACCDGENILFYQLDKLEELPGLVKALLQDDGRGESLAIQGKNLAEQGHTWEHRGYELADYLRMAKQIQKQQKRESSLTAEIIRLTTQTGGPFSGYQPDRIVELGKCLQEYKEIQEQKEPEEGKAATGQLMEKIFSLPYKKEQIYGQLLTEYFLLEEARDSRNTDRLLSQLLKEPELGWKNQLYLLNQLQSIMFTRSEMRGEETGSLIWKLYNKIYEGFCQELEEQCDIGNRWITREERNQHLVLVLTSQMLSMQHAPTKTALDRCYILAKHMRKQVVLVNTAEKGGEVGNVILLSRYRTSYKEELGAKETIAYKDIQIPYMQCSAHMPNIKETISLLEWVKQEKPSCIVNIGGESLVADRMSEMLPVLTIATVFSHLALTRSQYQMIGRELNERDRKILVDRGKEENHVISGRFTFALKEQAGKLTRARLGIPEDCFALLLIGARIGKEVTDELLTMLLSMSEEKIFLVFVGEMDYEAAKAAHPDLKEQGIYLGSQGDVLAVMELVDLYVNPYRNGGGSSVVEAMSKGIPAVTLPYGDVYVNTGETFAVPDYAAMKKTILRYVQDKEFYQKQAEAARQRADMLMDSKSAFTEVMEEFERRVTDGEWQADYYVSVIIPVYQAEAFIRRCLDSLTSQTIGFNNLQIIAVEDGSSDATWQILQEYETRYPDNILLIPLGENKGQGIARNIGMEYATGKYIGFVDADDWTEPEMYQTLYEVAEEKQCDMACCSIKRVSHFEKRKEKEDIDIQYYVLQDTIKKENFIFDNRENVMCYNKIYNRKFVEKNRLRFAEGLKYEDHYFGMLALLSADTIAMVKNSFYNWYRNPAGTCISGEHIWDRVEVQLALFEECKQRGYLKEYRELLEYNLYEKMVAETVFYLRQKGEDTTKALQTLMEILEELQISVRENKYFPGE